MYRIKFKHGMGIEYSRFCAISVPNLFFSSYKYPPSPCNNTYIPAIHQTQTKPPSLMAAIKAVHVSDVPNLDHVPENASSLYSTRFLQGADVGRSFFKPPKFLVIGHRGNGMNMLQSSDRRMKAIKENSLLSFNAAAKFPVDYVEFDVQVTSDGVPIVFHDNFILTEENDTVYERRVTELSLSEFMSYGPQRDSGKSGKSLLRKSKDGRIMSWNVETDDSMCTLQEVFQKVNPRLGFNIELKLDDHIVYQEEHLAWILEAILRVVSEHGGERPVVFSSFQPDAAVLVRKLQPRHPVFFLTNGGTEVYYDARRNSLEEAMKVCLEGGLQGVVSEVRGILRNPAAVNRMKEAKLSVMSYGKLNNVAEAVYMQHLMGVDGVIVDLVQHITEAVSSLVVKPVPEAGPRFSDKELSFLFKLIPELLQQ